MSKEYWLIDLKEEFIYTYSYRNGLIIEDILLSRIYAVDVIRDLNAVFRIFCGKMAAVSGELALFTALRKSLS